MYHDRTWHDSLLGRNVCHMKQTTSIWYVDELRSFHNIVHSRCISSKPKHNSTLTTFLRHVWRIQSENRCSQRSLSRAKKTSPTYLKPSVCFRIVPLLEFKSRVILNLMSVKFATAFKSSVFFSVVYFYDGRMKQEEEISHRRIYNCKIR